MRITIALLLIASAAAGSGCNKSSAGKSEDTSQSSAQLPPGVPPPAQMPANTGTAAIPDDFPKIVPIYPGANVVAATKTPGPSGKGAWNVGLVTNDEKNRVFTFFRANMSAFRQTTDSTVGPARTGTWQNAQYDVTVTVGEAPDKHTSIAMAVNAK